MLAVGIDIGGTKVAAGVVAEDGTIVDKIVRPSPTTSARAVEDTIVEICEEFSRNHEIRVVGIGAAGWVNAEGSVVRFSPHLAWRDEPLKEKLTARLPYEVWIDNDANTACWAEYTFGAGRGAKVMVDINLGTGIGGCVVINGELFRGAFGMAGEFGHMTVVQDGQWCPCGNRGCWEQYASGNALTRDARALIKEGSPAAQKLIEVSGADPLAITGQMVTELAIAGDRTSIELVGDVGEWLGKGLADVAAALDPDLFVIGGGVSEAGELLIEPARRAFSRHLTGRGHRDEARIELAHFRNNAGLIGAADLARRTVREGRR